MIVHLFLVAGSLQSQVILFRMAYLLGKMLTRFLKVRTFFSITPVTPNFRAALLLLVATKKLIQPSSPLFKRQYRNRLSRIEWKLRYLQKPIYGRGLVCLHSSLSVGLH